MAVVDKERVVAYLSALGPHELQDLILDLEERLGIERVLVGWPRNPTMGAPLDPTMEHERTEFDVMLLSGGDARIPVIMTLRTLLGVGLGEARRLLDASPVAVAEAVPRAQAEQLCEELGAAGAVVEIR